MTATPQYLGGVQFVTEKQAIPGAFSRPLAASAQAGKGQFVTVSPSTGYAALNDGTVPLQISAGQADCVDLSDTSTTAALARVRTTLRFFYGLPASTSSNDGFTDADVCVPFYIKDENTPAKLSNLSGSNRSLGGVCFGLADDGTPLLWSGPIAHILARAILLAQTAIGGWYGHAVDAMVSSTTAEKAMHRHPLHGVVTSITLTSLGTIVADNTDYVQINVYKADGAGGTHVLLGTYDSRAGQQGALAAGVPKSFGLSVVAGALNLLETDILSYEVLKAGAGKVVPVSTINVVQKAI